MSQPSAGVPGTGNRLTQPFRAAAAGYRRAVAGVTRWRNTQRGTKTLKGMYAQAARDAKRMDPVVRERIGRANMTKADLQSLAEAHITGAYDPRQRGYSRQLSGRATARAMTADQAVVRNNNPIRRVANTISRIRNTRQGTKALKGAYLQAKKDVGRMDPAVREAIGRSRITKADLQNLSESAMKQTFRPEGRQNPYQVQPRFQQQVQAQAQPQPQAQPQQQQQSPAQAQPQQAPAQQAPAQAQPQQAPAQGQAQQAPGQQAPGQTQGQQGPGQQQAAQQQPDPAVHNVQQVRVQAAPPRPQMSPAEAAQAQQARQAQQAQQGPAQQQPDPAVHNVRQVPVQAAPPRPQMSPAEAAQAQQARQAQPAAGQQAPGQQAQQASGQQQRRGPGQHRQPGRAQRMAAQYAARRQGSGRHRAGANHQAGQNQVPASQRAGGQQGLSIRQTAHTMKQFHQLLSSQSPAQQAATAAQVSSQVAALQSSPRTNGDAAKAFAGVAGAGGATAKPTSHRADRQGQPVTAPTSQRNADTKSKDPKLTR